MHRGAIGAARARIGAHRGVNIGKVAAGRKQLTLVYMDRAAAPLDSVLPAGLTVADLG